MRLSWKRGLLLVPAFLLLWLCSAPNANATVFRDRASFEAAAQNLSTIDFDHAPQPPDGFGFYDIDGVRFRGFNGLEVFGNTTDKKLVARTVGEITELTIYLPPGTTAVGLDQFSRPMEVSASSGESVTMAAGDGTNFAGFVSDQPLQTLTVRLDFPEPTPDAVIDNFTFGQRHAGNDPPKPLLLTYAPTGRAAAFESVGLTAEPFVVNVPRTQNLSIDGRTRITLLVAGLRFDPASDVPFVTARAVDAQQHVFELFVEGVGGAKNLSWLAQVTVLLPAELNGAGDLNVSVTVRGVESNKVTLRVN